MKPERLAEIRAGVAVAFDLAHERDSHELAEWVGDLLSAYDAVTAERDEARAAVARLRRIVELARVYRASVESETISDDLEDDARDALFDALDTCPPRQSDADLAEAHRGELRAEGMDEAADLCSGWCDETRYESVWGPVVTEAGGGMGTAARRLRQRASEIRGGK